MNTSEREAFSAMAAALRLVEWGNPAFDDVCPQCRNTRNKGHERWCQVGIAISAESEARGARDAG